MGDLGVLGVTYAACFGIIKSVAAVPPKNVNCEDEGPAESPGFEVAVPNRYGSCGLVCPAGGSLMALVASVQFLCTRSPATSDCTRWITFNLVPGSLSSLSLPPD